MTNSKGKKVTVHLKLRISSTSNWNNYQNNLKFHDSILPNVKEIHDKQKRMHSPTKKIKQNTKKQIHTLSIFSNTSTVEGFACLQGKEQRC